MPWSDWVLSAPTGFGAQIKTAIAVVSQQGFSDDPATLTPATHAAAAARAASGVSDEMTIGSPQNSSIDESTAPVSGSPLGSWETITTLGQHIEWYDVAVAGYPDARDWFPPELNALSEGIDYTIRPDRTGAEQDSYVEYDTGTGVLVGWNALAAMDIVNGSATLAGQAADLHVQTGLTAPPETSGPSAHPIWVLGSVVTSVAGVSPTIGAYVDFAGVVGVNEKFALAASTTSGGTFVSGQGAVGECITNYQAQLRSTVTALVQLPRWRYWKPDHPLPLRQRQRDDGLGLSGTPGWRGGSSRQSSNRWRGYL